MIEEAASRERRGFLNLVVGASAALFLSRQRTALAGEDRMLATFQTAVDYGQIIVEVSGHEAGSAIWTDDHVAQGFAWSPGSVGFGVPDCNDPCRVEVALASAITVGTRALWALRVPFHVPGKVLEIGTVTDPQPIAVPPGDYSLVFEALPGQGDAYVLHLIFCTGSHPDFEILRRGGELTTDKVLRKDVELALQQH